MTVKHKQTDININRSQLAFVYFARSTTVFQLSDRKLNKTPTTNELLYGIMLEYVVQFTKDKLIFYILLQNSWRRYYYYIIFASGDKCQF